MSNAKQLGFDVSYSSTSGAFYATNPKTGTDHSDCGLFHSNAAAPPGTDISLVATVDDKLSKYSKADYSHAEQACILQKSLMFPASKGLKSWLDKNIIRDCKLEWCDATDADDGFGPNTAILQGMTTWKKASNAPICLAPVPHSTQKRYRAVTLCVDIMFVNRIPFLVSISQHHHFGTIELLHSRTSRDLLAGIHRVYVGHGFQVTRVHGDPEFEPLHDDHPVHLE
jgi:hypothetical protein